MARSEQEEAAASGVGELFGKASAVGGGDAGVQDGGGADVYRETASQLDLSSESDRV